MHTHPSRRHRGTLRALGLATLTVLIGAATTPAAPAAAASSSPRITTSRVTVAGDGTQANASTLDSTISGNGRYVAYVSPASNLVPGDTNRADDVFLFDRRTGTTRRISVSTTGTQANGTSRTVTISADGRYVAFDSWASNLVPHDTNGALDAFLADTRTGRLTRISVTSAGKQASGDTADPVLSADGRFVALESHSPGLIPGTTGGNVILRDLTTGRNELISVPYHGANNPAEGISYQASVSSTGRYVAFASWQSDLVPGDTNHTMDLFLRDRWTRRTVRVNVSSTGRQSSTWAFGPQVSDDGRYVTFSSDDAALVRGDTNRLRDVFLRDLRTRTTTRVSVSRTGAQANNASVFPQITPDGRYLAYTSYASNLVCGDDNGAFDIFVRRLRTGDTTLISRSPAGRPANGGSMNAHLSADGHDIAYSSEATNLVRHDTNGRTDVFVGHRPH